MKTMYKNQCCTDKVNVMHRTFSKICIVICMLAAFSGAIQSDLYRWFYEEKNGPPVFTKNRKKQLMKIPYSRIVYPKVAFPYDFWLDYRELSDEVSFANQVEEDVYVGSKILKLDNQKYQINSSTYSFEGKNSKRLKEIASHVGLSKRILSFRKLNERIDSIHFPNEKTRKAEKEKILSIIEQYLD